MYTPTAGRYRARPIRCPRRVRKQVTVLVIEWPSAVCVERNESSAFRMQVRSPAEVEVIQNRRFVGI